MKALATALLDYSPVRLLALVRTRPGTRCLAEVPGEQAAALDVEGHGVHHHGSGAATDCTWQGWPGPRDLDVYNLS